MRRPQLVAALSPVLGLVLTGCSSPPPKTAPAPMSMPPAVIEAPKPVVQRQPTKEIAVRFPYAANEEVTTLAYSDLGPLGRPSVVQAIAGGLAGWANEVAGVDRACVDAILGGAKEVLVGGGARGWVAVLRIPDHKLETQCTPAAKSGAATTMEGTTKAWLFAEEGRACATTPGWLACGHPELVKQALAANGDGLVPVSLNPHEVLTLDDRDAQKDVRLLAFATPEKLETRVELTYDSDEEARTVHEMLSHAATAAPAMLKSKGSAPEQQRIVERIAQNLVAIHRGPRASVRVDLAGTPDTQAKDIGDFASVVASGLRAAKNEARKETARAALKEITDKLAAAWETKDPKSPFAGHAKVVSLPAVPKTVPKGERVVSPEGAWKSWSVLGWSPTTPSFYQYEIIAAKDGQACDVIARGDLDGNGKTSSFTRHVRVDKSSKQLMIEDVTETDPDE